MRPAAAGVLKHPTRIIVTLARMPGLIGMMKPLILTVALFGTMAAACQKSNADEVIVRTGGGHENYNWNHEYWHHHRYGY
jgi:hypothetical protein